MALPMNEAEKKIETTRLALSRTRQNYEIACDLGASNKQIENILINGIDEALVLLTEEAHP